MGRRGRRDIRRWAAPDWMYGVTIALCIVLPVLIALDITNAVRRGH